MEGVRSVAITPALASRLRKHRLASRYSRDGHPIFASVTVGNRDDHNVRRELRPATKRAGVPWVTPHVFRHTLATRPNARGYNAHMIATVLGHTDEGFTRRVYVHGKDTRRFDDLDALEVAGYRRG